MSQSGMISIFQDFPFSPDMVSEIKVVTSSYEPQYGSSTSGQIVATTKSGSDRFHGAVFEYHQNDSLNANQWGADEKSPLKKNNFGANLGGPAKVPGLWSNCVKTYFYANFEGYRQTGGANRPTLSIPSLQAAERRLQRLARRGRQPDPDLRPRHDARAARRHRGRATPSRATSSRPTASAPSPGSSSQFLPTPTSDGPLNNYLVPTRDPGHHPGRQQLLLRPLRHVHRPEGPRRDLAVAPARPGQVLLDAAPRARQRDLLRPPELLGATASTGTTPSAPTC